jgi:hypothetical protein
MIELKDQAQRFETDVRPGFINKVDFTGDGNYIYRGFC